MADIIGFALTLFVPILIILLVRGIKTRNLQTELYDSILCCIEAGITIEFNGRWLDCKYGRIRIYYQDKDEFFDWADADKSIEKFLNESGFMKYWESQHGS